MHDREIQRRRRHDVLARNPRGGRTIGAYKSTFHRVSGRIASSVFAEPCEIFENPYEYCFIADDLNIHFFFLPIIIVWVAFFFSRYFYKAFSMTTAGGIPQSLSIIIETQ